MELDWRTGGPVEHLCGTLYLVVFKVILGHSVYLSQNAL